MAIEKKKNNGYSLQASDCLEKTKLKDWQDKIKDSKDAIEKVQKVEKKIEDMKRGQQEKKKKTLRARDYPYFNDHKDIQVNYGTHPNRRE